MSLLTMNECLVMKTEFVKTKSFNIEIFETLDSKGNALLKGGFSPVYSENLNLGGKATLQVPIVNNMVAGCDCIIVVNNNASGCGGPMSA